MDIFNKILAFEKSVGAVVFRRENDQIKFLLLDHGDDYWNFPKGHGEAKETNEETLRREIAEETGIKELKIFSDFRKTSYYFYRATGQEKAKRLATGKNLNVFKSVIFYLAETAEMEIKLSPEHKAFAWLTFPEALLYLKYTNLKKVLNKAWKEIKKEV